MESFTLGLMRGDGAPLYRQLYRHIVEEIASGGLAAGEKLPSKRRLAADLRVSVSTVETAYQMLVAEGYIAARAKSGFTVCRIEKLDAPVRPAPAAPPACRASSVMPSPSTGTNTVRTPLLRSTCAVRG